MKAQVVVPEGELFEEQSNAEPRLEVEIQDHRKEHDKVRAFLELCKERGGAEVRQEWSDTISFLIIRPKSSQAADSVRT